MIIMINYNYFFGHFRILNLKMKNNKKKLAPITEK